MANRKPTKLSLALAYLQANPGATRYQAAKHAGLKQVSPLYAHIKRQSAKAAGICPTCGQSITCASGT